MTFWTRILSWLGRCPHCGGWEVSMHGGMCFNNSCPSRRDERGRLTF